MKMNPQVKKMWVTALRSGAYEQGKKALHARPPGSGDKYCCLGVLCKLAVAEGVIDPGYVDVSEIDGVGGMVFFYDGKDDTLPQSVMNWAGLADENPDTSRPSGDLTYAYILTLAQMNDQGMSFETIADQIEKDF